MAWAAISGGHVSAGSTDGNTFTTASCDTTGGNTLCAIVGDLDGTSVVTDSKTNTWVQLTGASKIGSFPCVSVWYAKNATCGTGHTFTVTGTSVYPSINVQAFSGGDTSAPFDTGKESGDQGASVASIQPGSLTPSVNDCLLITGEASDSASSGSDPYSVSSPFTRTDYFLLVGGAAFGSGMGYLIQTTAAAANPTWSYPLAVGGFRANLAAFKSSVGGPSPQTVTPDLIATAEAVYTPSVNVQDRPELYGRPRLSHRQMQQLLAQ